jgi:hypothetical protein
MDLTTDLEHRLVARQMRHAVLAYMAGPQFNPGVEVPLTAIRELTMKKGKK